MKISKLEYVAYFSYTPRPQTEAHRYAKNQTLMLKRDEMREDHTCQSVYMVQEMAKSSNDAVRSWFDSQPVLVPIPSSHPTHTGDLWVSQRIAESMVSEGFGREVVSCVKRVRPLPKSASSTSQNRPKAHQHYESFSVETLTDSNDLVLVDDVVTRGATLMGAANRLTDVLPSSKIRAFALVRTQSNPEDFDGFVDYVEGLIELRGNEAYRK